MPAHLRVLIALAALCLLAACHHLDDNGAIEGPRSLGVGAYAVLGLGDACAGNGGGKLWTCHTEKLVRLDSLYTLDTDVLRILPGAETPFGWDDSHAMLGLKPGVAVVRAVGLFDDSTLRAAEIRITVRRVDGAKVVSSCSQAPGSTVYAAPGQTVGFTVWLTAGGDELGGVFPDALHPVPDMTEGPGRHSWTSPADPVRVNLTSRYVKGTLGTLKTLVPGDYTSMKLSSSYYGTSMPFFGPGRFEVGAEPRVGAYDICASLPGSLRSLTPAVCGGPEGAAQWPLSGRYGATVQALREGVCRLQGTIDGKRYFETLTLEVFMLTPHSDSVRVRPGDSCAVEGASRCFGFFSLSYCKDGKWAEDKRWECGERRFCDQAVPSTPGCVPGGDCAQCRGLRP